MMDGKEVHYSMNRTGILDHSWTARGNHILKVVCHAAAPMTANPNFRQYDLFIDGQSFFLMPKVYELGLRGGGRAAASAAQPYGSSAPAFASPSGSIRAPRDPREEEEELQRAINASIEESKKHLGENRSPAPATQRDLLALDDGPASPGFDTMSFASAPPPNYPYAQPPAPYAQQPPTPQYAQQPPTPQYSQGPPPPPPRQYAQPTATPTYPSSNAGAASFPALPPSSTYGAPPPQAPTAYGAPPPPQQQQAPPPPAYGAPPPQQSYAPAPPAYVPPTNFEPVAGADDPFAPKPPTHNDIANEILSAYSASTPTSAVGGQFSFDSPPAQNGGGPTPPAQNMTALVEVKEEEPLNPFEAALKKLVNVDHIDEPAEEQLKLTMKAKEDKDAHKNKGKSRGLPPVAKGQVGSQATLAQISSVKSQKAKREDIMKTPPQLFHPDAAAAGMLVVHGQTPNGPPPLQPQGFGVGYGYGQPPQGYGYGGYR